MAFTKRGLPDDYDVVREFLATALHDDAELAIRLGGPVSINRQGNVIYANSFDAGLGAMYGTTSGANSAVALSNNAPRSRGVCVQLSAGPSNGTYAALTCGLRLPDALSMAVEFAVAGAESASQVQLSINVYDGVNHSEYGVKIVSATGACYFYNAAGEWEQTDAVPILDTGYGIYHQIKLVIDNGDLIYRRLVVDETQIDLSGELPYVSASTDEKLVQFTITYTNVGVVTKTASIDDVIATLNEI